MKKLLVALSGGVDSAVAALCLREAGHAIEGAFIKSWMHEDESSIFADCPWEQDLEDARQVAETLGIPFEVVDLIDEYREHVVDYLVEGYRNGTTPNPDLLCNREMKFGFFLEHARRRGFEGVATGHYCRRLEGANGPELHEGLDGNKDQSYFLALLRADQLAQAHFPIGELEKPRVRELAREAKLPTADKKDSQGICFLGKVRINDFLEQFIEQAPGPIVNREGKVLGEHKGLHRYTLGQRKGIGLPSNTDNEHYVVVARDYTRNELVVAFDQPELSELYGREYRLERLSFLADPGESPVALQAKARYRDPSTPITFERSGEDTAHITFEQTQRALAPGQLCALYDGSRLLGGGFYAR